MSRDTHQMEMLLFINAADSLAQGNHSSGTEAYIEAHNSRLPDGLRQFNPLTEATLGSKELQYFREMGAFVELAVELNNEPRES